MFQARSSWILVTGALLLGCSAGSPSGSPSTTPPVGKQLVAGALTLRGMTSDGWVVYSDDQTLTLHAVPVTGGASQSIVTLGDSFAISVWGSVVFAWSNKNEAGVAPLTVWTSAHGPHAVSKASLAPWVAASADGSTIQYLDHVDPTGETGDLVGAASDGSGATVLAAALTGLMDDGCQAVMGFAGAYAIAAHCSGGAKQATISSFAPSTWRRADLASNASDAWTVDPSGARLLTATSAGTIVVPVAGGTPTIVDPAGSTGVLVGNGDAVVYGASKDQLRRSPVSSPAPVTLVTSGVGGMYGVSPNEKFVLFWAKMDPVHLVSDMYLSSTTTPGAPLTLSATQTAGIFGDAYTQDSSHVLYSTDVDATAQTSTLDALALGTKAPMVLARDVWLVDAGVGARVVWNDHYAWTGARGHADVEAADLAKGPNPTLIVRQADAEIFLSPSRDEVVYTWSLDDGPRQGMWVAGIP